jgi:TonB family protein
MKKLSLFAFCLAVLCLSQNVQARVWDGKIDSEWYWENPKQKEFTISTAEQLAGLAQLVNGGNDFSGKTIKLTASIMLNDTANWRGWSEDNPKNVWTPIGSYTNENNNRPFSGTFDGGGNVISGVYINNSSSYQGLFGYISKATIKKFGVVASYVRGGSIVGGLAGFNNNGTITNSYSTVNVVGSSSVGGLVGSNKGTITNCYSAVNVVGGSIVGGLVGSNEGTIANSYAMENVYSSSGGIYAVSIGGLVGNNGGTITDCYATGNVVGGKSVGGLVGSNHKAITNCYAKGNVASHGFGFGGLVGGLVGENSGKIANCYATGSVQGNGGQGNNIGGLVGSNSGTINDCHAAGNVTGQDNIGGLVGFDGGSTIVGTETTAGGTITNCYATGDVKGSSRVGGLVGIDIGSSAIKNSFATGNVTGERDNIGGLVGSNGGTIMNSYAGGNIDGKNNIGGLVGVTSGKITIANCYAVGKVSGTTGSTIGGLTGINDGGTIKSSYYDRQASTQVDINKGEPKSTVQMKQQATFAGWDFSKIWKIDANKNNGYPYLRSNGNVTETMKREALNLAVAISSDYLQIWARGGFLPKVFFKEMWTFRCKSDNDTITYDPSTVSASNPPKCQDGTVLDAEKFKYSIETIHLWTLHKESEEDSGKIEMSVYSKSDSVYLDGNNEFIAELSAVKPGSVVATLSESSARKLACGQSDAGVEDICSDGKIAVSLKPRSAYDDIAKLLIMIRNRFIDSPDADSIVIFFESDIDSSKMVNITERARKAGFLKIKFASAKGSLKAPSARDIDMGNGDSSRSKAEIMAVVNARMPGLRNIYNKYLKLKPGFNGKVTLKFTIAPGGDIVNISIVSSTTSYSEFDTAVKNMVATWKWKVIKSGDTTPTIPFNFTE